MMYEARSLKELKEQIRVHEKIKEPHLSQNRLIVQQNVGGSKYGSRVQPMGTKKKYSKERHIAKYCQGGGNTANSSGSSASGAKCFKC